MNDLEEYILKRIKEEEDNERVLKTRDLKLMSLITRLTLEEVLEYIHENINPNK